MKITIITVCKNEVSTIENTILSLLGQTYRDFEWIVIDGNSDDGTIDVVEKYREHAAYFVSEKDSGIYSAMNKGIRLAGGEILYFLNANDVFADEFVLEKIIKIFDENPSIEFLFGNINMINPDKTLHCSLDYRDRYDDFWFFQKFGICQQAIFYKKSLFEKYGLFKTHFLVCGDTERNMNFLIKHKAAALYVPFPIANFLVGGISMDVKYQRIMKSEKKSLVHRYYFKYFIFKFLKYFSPKLYLRLLNIDFYSRMASAKMNVKLFDIKLLEI